MCIRDSLPTALPALNTWLYPTSLLPYPLPAGYCLNILAIEPLTWLNSFLGSWAAKFCVAMPRHTSFFVLTSSRSTTNCPLWMVTVVLPHVPASAGPNALGSKGGMPPVAMSVSYTHLRAHETVLDLVC